MLVCSIRFYSVNVYRIQNYSWKTSRSHWFISVQQFDVRHFFSRDEYERTKGVNQTNIRCSKKGRIVLLPFSQLPFHLSYST